MSSLLNMPTGVEPLVDRQAAYRLVPAAKGLGWEFRRGTVVQLECGLVVVCKPQGIYAQGLVADTVTGWCATEKEAVAAQRKITANRHADEMARIDALLPTVSATDPTQFPEIA